MGTSPFLPDAGNANATARTDMNNFLRSYAHQWAAIPVGAIKQIDPKHLIFGPNNLAGGQVTVPYLRTPILLGLKDAGVDGLYTSWRPSLNDIAMAKLAYDTTGLPIIEWIGWAANCDSSFNINYDAGSGTPNGTYPKCGAQGDNYPFQNYTYQTSPSRAIAYFNAMPLLYNATGADGMYYIIGADWWDLQDYPRHEDTNWGLLTMADNAYDGNCTIPTVNGVQKFDAFGYKCGNPDDTPDPTWLTVGGGAAGYGAFLPTVTKSNLIWWNSLLNYYSNQGRTGGSNVTGGLWTGDIH
jgi:hypothetical protein